MRLALIYHQFVRRGGLENYLLAFADALAARGHSLTLFGADFGPEAESLAQRGAVIERARLTPVSKALRMVQFARAASGFAADFARGGGKALGFGRTVVQDAHRAGGGCHAIYSRLLPWHKRWRLKNRIELDLERQLYTGGGTRRFVVNAAPVGDQIQAEYGIDPAKIEVIHTAVDSDAFHPPAGEAERADLRSQLVPGARGDRPAFVFASLDHARKGLGNLLAIWDRVDAELWVAGKPPSSAWRRAADRQGVRDKVIWLGRADLAPLFRAADFFIHPTLYDACANTALQAMASALPSLISVRCGSHEFVRPGETGWLLDDPGSPEAILAAVRSALAAGEPARASLGAAARRQMLPLTWDAHVGRWEAMLG